MLTMNGGVLNETSNEYQSVISLTCSRGYKLPDGFDETDTVATCLANSSWSISIPDCEGVLELCSSLVRWLY